jgi:CcmD family protein
MRSLLVCFATMAALLLAPMAAAPVVFAQDGSEDAADDGDTGRSAAFQAATGAQTENVPGGALLLTAYAIAWLLIFGYVASLGFRLAGTARDMERLREDVAAAVGDRPGEDRG